MSGAAHGVASLHNLPLGNRAVASVEVADADRQLRQIIIQGFSATAGARGSIRTSWAISFDGVCAR